jgi:biopolymer transport protein ExbB
MNELFKKSALLGDVWVLWVLLFASVLSVAVMIDRWRVFRMNRLDFPAFLTKLKKFLETNDMAAAHSLCESHAALEARVALTGLQNFSRGAASAEEAMKSSLVLERSFFEKNLIILSTMGNNAPFIGLLGTVLGVIKAFHDLGVAGSSGVSVVMSGISAALIATAFGILLAIPAVIANNFFQTRLKRSAQNTQALIHLMQVYLKSEEKESHTKHAHKHERVSA